MKPKLFFPLLVTLALLGVAAVAVFLTGRIAEENWQAPDSGSAPTVTDTATEQVQTELKEYPYQILTLSAAQILYKEVAQAAPQLTVRENGEGCITAAKAAALAGELAMTLYGSDLGEKQLDLLPVRWCSDDAQTGLDLWLAAYTLPDAIQTAPDGSTYDATQGCWLFCLDAADGALLYSRCTALEGEANESILENSDLLIPDEEMLELYNRSLALAEKSGLSPTGFYGGETLDDRRGIVQTVFLTLSDDRICRLTYDKYFQTGALYSIAIAPPRFFDERPQDFDYLPLPLQLSRSAFTDLPSAVTLAENGDHSLVSKPQSASFSTSDGTTAYVSDYHNFDDFDFLLYRFDPSTGKRSLLCSDESCPHTQETTGCLARTYSSGMVRIFADEGNVYALPSNERLGWNSIEQVYPAFRLIHSFTGEKTGKITNAVADGDKIYALYFTGSSAVLSDVPLHYELYCIDAASGEAELLSTFSFRYFRLIGKLENYLLFSTVTGRNAVTETDAGLQPHDAGQREVLFAFDLSDKKLSCIYDSYPDDYYTVDMETGRLWRAHGLRGALRRL